MIRLFATSRTLWWGVPLLLVLLWVAGSLLPATDVGIPQAPWTTYVSLPVVRFCRDIIASVTLGCVLIGGLVVPGRSLRALRWASVGALIWLIVLLVQFILTISDVLAVPLSGALDPTTVWSVMTQVTLGRVFVWQLAAVLTVGLLAQAVVSRPTAWVVITLASAACLAPSFLGHGGLTGGHAAATISLAVHLVSVSVWLGGLAAVVALLLVDPRLSQSTLPRFSAVALGAAVVAAESGLLNASIRLTAPALFLTTWYGALVIGKVILIGWLAYFGLQQRRNVLPQLDAEGAVSSRGLARYAATEFILMGCAVGVAVAMSRIGPLAAPNSNGLPNLVSVSVLLLGLPALAPLLFNRAAPAILTRNPEVMGVIAAVITIELFGLNLLGRLLGAQLGALVSICAIMLIGWALAISLHGSDRRSGVYTTMLSWIVACGVTLYFQLREPQAVVDTRSVLAASLLGVGFLALHLVPPLADSSNTQALEWHESASD